MSYYTTCRVDELEPGDVFDLWCNEGTFDIHVHSLRVGATHVRIVPYDVPGVWWYSLKRDLIVTRKIFGLWG